MIDLRTKFFTLVGTTLALLCLSCTSSWAADVDVTKKVIATDAAKWAKTKGGQLEALAEALEGDVILCGSDICNKSAEKCIKCEEYFQSSGGSVGSPPTLSTRHRCIDTNKKASEFNTSSYGMGYMSSATCKDATESGTDTTTSGFWTTKHKACKTAGDGKMYCFSMVGKDLTIEYGDADKSMKGCEVLPVKLYNMRKCFFCPLFSVVFAASEKMTYISFSKLAGDFATLIALGLAIWIAFQTLTHVSSLTKQDAPKFLAGLIKQSYKFVIAFMLLQYGGQIFEHAVNPILNAGIQFGGVFLENAEVSEEVQKIIDKEIDDRADEVPAHGYYIKNAEKPGEPEKELYKDLDGYVAKVQREISFMQAIGTSLICTGGRSMMGKTDKETFGDGFQMMIQGIVYAVFAFLLSIAFAFYMIDAVVQLGIVGGLMPFLIASWPFKVTAQYAGTGFKMMLNSAFIFVFIGLTIEVNMQLINSAISMTSANSEQASKDAAGNLVDFGGLQAVAIAINEQDSEALIRLTDISTLGFLILIFCCIFGFKFLGQVSSLAGQMSSGGIKPTAPSIATMGASAALSGAKKISKPVREAVGRKMEDGGMALLGGAGTLISAPFSKSSRQKIANVFKKKGGSGGGSDTEEKPGSQDAPDKKGSKETVAQNTNTQTTDDKKKKSITVGEGGSTDSATTTAKKEALSGDGNANPDASTPDEKKPTTASGAVVGMETTTDATGTQGVQKPRSRKATSQQGRKRSYNNRKQTKQKNSQARKPQKARKYSKKRK